MSYEYLKTLKDVINDEGLELHAIENFDPGDWYDEFIGWSTQGGADRKK